MEFADKIERLRCIRDGMGDLYSNDELLAVDVGYGIAGPLTNRADGRRSRRDPRRAARSPGGGRMTPEIDGQERSLATRKALREVAAGKIDQFSAVELTDLGLGDVACDDVELMKRAERLLAADPVRGGLADNLRRGAEQIGGGLK